MAGDITPIELVAHIPILCEKSGTPYIYVGTKESLAAGSLSKNPTTVMMLCRPSKSHSVRDDYINVFNQIVELNPYLGFEN